MPSTWVPGRRLRARHSSVTQAMSGRESDRRSRAGILRTPIYERNGCKPLDLLGLKTLIRARSDSGGLGAVNWTPILRQVDKTQFSANGQQYPNGVCQTFGKLPRGWSGGRDLKRRPLPPHLHPRYEQRWWRRTKTGESLIILGLKMGGRSVYLRFSQLVDGSVKYYESGLQGISLRELVAGK